jgi:hypothetical protein
VLNVDFKTIPSSALSYLLTFMPGLFFLSAIAIGNPYLTSDLTARLLATIPFDHYAAIFVALFLFLAFVTGATFITLVALIQYLPVRYVWRLWFRSKPFLCKRALLPILKHLMATPKPKPQWLINLHGRAMDTVFPPLREQQPAYRWWKALTKQLLRKRCGMKDSDLPPTSMYPLTQVLTEPSPREQRGNVMMVALHATGWSALAAAYFAPELRATWLYLFALFLIANGLYHDMTLIKLLIDPSIGDMLRLRAVLREFPKLKAQPIPEKRANDNAEEDQ